MRLSTLPMLLCLALPAAATAADASPGAAAGAGGPACVDVEVDGYRALSYQCLSQQMAPRERPPHENPAMASEDIARRAPNQIGLANRAATSNRMGSNFGKSAYPQRPLAQHYAPPVLPAR